MVSSGGIGTSASHRSNQSGPIVMPVPLIPQYAKIIGFFWDIPAVPIPSRLKSIQAATYQASSRSRRRRTSQHRCVGFPSRWRARGGGGGEARGKRRVASAAVAGLRPTTLVRGFASSSEEPACASRSDKLLLAAGGCFWRRVACVLVRSYGAKYQASELAGYVGFRWARWARPMESVRDK